MEEDEAKGFLVKGRAFAKQAGWAKRFGHDTNIEGNGQCMPQGHIKHVHRVSILVDGADGLDVVEARFVVGQVPFPWFKVFQGTQNAVEPPLGSYRGIPEMDPKERVKREEDHKKKGFRLLPLEQFHVEVEVPKHLRGNYTMISLHGPMLVAVTS